MKRKLTFGIFLVTLTFLSGCGGVIELSDDENRAIAEYSAELLLKHSIGYESKYFDGEEELANAVSTESDTAETTEYATTEASTQDTSEQTTQAAAASTEQAISYETDIADILHITDLSIIFNHYDIVESYPSRDETGALVYIDAPSGMKLLVTEFDLSNLSDVPLDVNLLNVDVGYSIVMNDSKSAKSMLTILMDDLSTYEATLAPETDEKAVLVFQISDELTSQIQSLDLKVTYEDSEHMIQIQ